MAEQKVAQASPAGPRKKRRMGVSESFKMEIGVEQTIAMLKAEAVSVKHAGIAGFLGDDGAVVMEKLEPYLNSHLTVLTNASYPDREGKEHAGDNETTTGDFEALHRDLFDGFRAGTGTVSFTISAEICMSLYCDLVLKLRCDSSSFGNDGQAMVQLDRAGGQAAKMSGGFTGPYQLVATQHFNKAMQDRCIFGFKSSGVFEKECGPAAKALTATVFTRMKSFFRSCNVTSKGVHVLFHWNAHSLFTYHKDPNSIVTVIVQLTPGNTDFHVAGRSQSAVYTTAGSAHLFCSQAYHRSGTAQRRTIKVAYFFDVDVIDLEKEDGKEKKSDGKEQKSDPFVQEVKPSGGGAKLVPSQLAAASSLLNAAEVVAAQQGPEPPHVAADPHVNDGDPRYSSLYWIEATAPDGRTYYYNTMTCESAWVRPEQGAPPARLMPLSTEPPHVGAEAIATASTHND